MKHLEWGGEKKKSRELIRGGYQVSYQRGQLGINPTTGALGDCAEHKPQSDPTGEKGGGVFTLPFPSVTLVRSIWAFIFLLLACYLGG